MDELVILSEKAHELKRARRLDWRQRPLAALTDEDITSRLAEIHGYIVHCKALRDAIMAQVPADKVESHTYTDHLERRDHFVGARERLAQLTDRGQDYLWGLRQWAEWLHGSKEWISSEFYRSLDFERPVAPDLAARRQRWAERNRRVRCVFDGLLDMVEVHAEKNGEQPSWARQEALNVWNGEGQREKGAAGLVTFCHELAGAKLIDGKYMHDNARKLVEKLWRQ